MKFGHSLQSTSQSGPELQIGGKSSARFREPNVAGLESDWPLDLQEIMQAVTTEGSGVELNALSMDVGTPSPPLSPVAREPTMVKEKQTDFGSNITVSSTKTMAVGLAWASGMSSMFTTHAWSMYNLVIKSY